MKVYHIDLYSFRCRYKDTKKSPFGKHLSEQKSKFDVPLKSPSVWF